MSNVGNDLWWSQVEDVQREMDAHYKRAELELFHRIYMRMREHGYSKGQIMKHFQDTFTIHKTAYYTRLREAGMFYVLR